MIRILAVLIALAFAAPALAQEPVGCDKFKWPLDREKAMLVSAPATPSGGEATQPAVKLALVALAEAKLPEEPTRKPKPETFAGFVRVPALPNAGTYRITLSEGGWIDVFQEGREVKSAAFSGATGCEGVRKSVKFDLKAASFVIVVTGVAARAIGIAVTAD